ncbi:shieldin complex subunit 2 isoform X2 [Rhinatrema bivittatum]|uniref:shieldin complex subunit 2 isoform X2 n=1 Tax=Rhinatrema bivittatum TaxID=194408 RepID=UPI001129EA22|nr:shieldin complex subunit 2 isoform X2 [Rhinatrema bivittatum]
MSKQLQIHIFLGAPIIATQQETSKEQRPSVANVETWRESHIVCDKQFFSVGVDKCKADNDSKQENLELVTTGVSELFSTAHESEAACTEVHKTTTKSQNITAVFGHKISKGSVTDQHVIKKADQQYRKLCEAHTDGQCVVDITEKGNENVGNYCADISVLISCTKHIQPSSLDQNNDPSHHHNILHESICQYLEACFPDRAKQWKGPRESESVCLEEVSADTEFLSILTASQVAIQEKRQVKKQDHMQNDVTQTEDFRKDKEACSELFQSNQLFLGTHLIKHEPSKDTASSLELFTPVSLETTSNCEMLHTIKGRACQENTEASSELSSGLREELQTEIHIKPWSSGILCSQLAKSSLDSSKRRMSMPEEFVDHSSTAFENQQDSKRVKQMHSPANHGLKEDLKKVLEFQHLVKKSVLLRNCCCKSQKYTVLVTVVHACRINEIQIKSGPKAGSTVPLATIVVFDQSEVERKVVLWRSAAFWSLTVFPGDIVLLSDVSVYEDSWYGETMLQTSFGSQLLNLGRCSSLNHKELGVTALQDLLAYVSLKHGYLWDLPERQPQSLEHVQHVHLSRLQPDTLVHSVLQVLSIIVLTESVYLYKGQKQRKIILTVEQVKGQPYTLVLWGTATAWYPQIQRRKGHLWEFRNILSQRNSLTGEIELHTTPWSSCECLFDDDKRAIDFKAQYQTNKASAMEQVIGIAALLEEKFSGCGACGSELKLDENKIYLQCFNCLPVNQVKTYYRPALMTAVDGEHMIHVHVPSEILQKIFLNIPPDWLNRTIVSSSDVTYGMIVADLCHSLLTSSEDSYRLKIQSSFELDENSVPMQQDFFLLDFHQDLLYSEISPEEQAIWKGSGTQKKIVKEV